MTSYINKRRNPFIIIVFALLLLLVFTFGSTIANAAPEDNITVEYRYTEGETVVVPETIKQFGQDYNLISQEPPVLESSMPSLRTYNFRITGALTEKELATLTDLPGFTATPVYIDREREVEREKIITQRTNDIDDIPLTEVFQVSSASSGTIDAPLNRSGVTFDDSKTTYDPWGLPTSYTAKVIYRGVETYQELGYYSGQATFQKTAMDGSTNVYIIVATYEPTSTDGGTITTTTTTPAEPTDSTGSTTPEPVSTVPNADFTEEELRMMDSQTPLSATSPFKNIADGLTPLGSAKIGSAWSVLSLFFSMLAVILLIITVIGTIAGRKNYLSLPEEEQAFYKKRKSIIRALLCIFSVLTPVTWLALEDMTTPQVWINRWTLYVGIALILTIILFIAYFRMNTKNYKRSQKKESLKSVTA